MGDRFHAPNQSTDMLNKIWYAAAYLHICQIYGIATWPQPIEQILHCAELLLFAGVYSVQSSQSRLSPSSDRHKVIYSWNLAKMLPKFVSQAMLTVVRPFLLLHDTGWTRHCLYSNIVSALPSQTKSESLGSGEAPSQTLVVLCKCVSPVKFADVFSSWSRKQCVYDIRKASTNCLSGILRWYLLCIIDHVYLSSYIDCRDGHKIRAISSWWAKFDFEMLQMVWSRLS